METQDWENTPGGRISFERDRETMTSTSSLTTKLPNEILVKGVGFKPETIDQSSEPELSYLEKRLPTSDIGNLRELLLNRYPLAKESQIYVKRIKKTGGKKKQFSNSLRRELGLYKVSRTGLKFKELLPIHLCWSNYMEEYLDLKQFDSLSPEVLPTREDLLTLLWKADYHGAYLIVSKSKCPSLVGIEGILVFETKATVQLLGIDDIVRTVPKESCEFKLKIGSILMTFLGKNFIIRPAERSRKSKAVISLNL